MLGWGSSATREVDETIRAICKVEWNDGTLFDGESVEGTKIKEEDESEGVRVKLHAVLAGARIPMQVDIGFGDAIYPEPEFASFPVLLPMEPPVIRAYPREAAIGENLDAMVVLDIRNSRMKDFYDIWFMANTWTFEMATLREAIRASFVRRGVGIPQDVPFALTEEFVGDPQKTRHGNAFVSRLYPGSDSPSLEEVGILLRAFLLPCILSVPAPESTAHYWTPSLHWSEQK